MLKKTILFALAVSQAVILNAIPVLEVSGEGAYRAMLPLRNTYRNLARIFNINYLPANQKVILEIVLTPAIPPDKAEFEHHLRHWTLAINPDFADENVRRQLYRVMLAALSGSRVPIDLHRMPYWIFLAVDGELAASELEEKWLKGNRIRPAGRFWSAENKFPKVSEFSRLSRSSACRDALRAQCTEVARAILWTNRKKAGGYRFVKSLTEKPEETEKMLLSNISQKDFENAVRALSWNEFHPKPYWYTRKQLHNWRQVTIPELNEKFEPTGKTITKDILELPPVLAKRPDKMEILNQTIQEIDGIAKGESLETKNAFRKLGTALRLLPEKNWPNQDKDVQLAIAGIERELAKRRRLEDYLNEQEKIHTPVRELYFNRLSSVHRDLSGTPEEISKFADQAEEKYN